MIQDETVEISKFKHEKMLAYTFMSARQAMDVYRFLIQETFLTPADINYTFNEGTPRIEFRLRAHDAGPYLLMWELLTQAVEALECEKRKLVKALS
jgi:hypothetical protein